MTYWRLVPAAADDDDGHLEWTPRLRASWRHLAANKEKREGIDRYFIRIKAAETPATAEGHLLILRSNAFFKYWM